MQRMEREAPAERADEAASWSGPDADGDDARDEGPRQETTLDLGDGRGRSWRHPSIEAVVLLLFVAMAARVGLRPLFDNSFLTHLATGRLILDGGGVPTTDPYSWTAAGEPWTVQSWGASVLYGLLERVAGLVGIRVLTTACTVGLVLLLWRLSRPLTNLVSRTLVVGLAVCMSPDLWTERPLLLGAVFLAVVLVAAEDGLDPRWLVPLLWVWVNVHGSFPFAVAVLALLAAGRWLDERRRPSVELRALGWTVLGTVLGALGPLGFRALTFPLTMLAKREAFADIVEWGPPRWELNVYRIFAAQLALTVVVVALRHRRWRAVLPMVVFGLAAITSARNVLPASIVLTPILAAGLAGLGSIDGRARPRPVRPVAAALVVLVVLVGAIGLADRDIDLDPYPVAASEWMRAEGLLGVGDRVVHRDYAGNFLHYRYGPDQVRTFTDDRVDMYPLAAKRRYVSLFRDDVDHQLVLDEVGATAVLWETDTTLQRWLDATGDWEVVYRDEAWMVAVPA